MSISHLNLERAIQTGIISYGLTVWMSIPLAIHPNIDQEWKIKTILWGTSLWSLFWNPKQAEIYTWKDKTFKAINFGVTYFLCTVLSLELLHKLRSSHTDSTGTIFTTKWPIKLHNYLSSDLVGLGSVQLTQSLLTGSKSLFLGAIVAPKSVSFTKSVKIFWAIQNFEIWTNYLLYLLF